MNDVEPWAVEIADLEIKCFNQKHEIESMSKEIKILRSAYNTACKVIDSVGEMDDSMFDSDRMNEDYPIFISAQTRLNEFDEMKVSERKQ